MSSRGWIALGMLIAVAAGGCSSVRGSAIRTGAPIPPYAGPVGIYAASVPEGGTELGVVEVHATQQEANVELLLPMFVQKVASLGGNAAIIDQVSARFDIVPRAYVETYSYPCGFRGTCMSTRMHHTNDEVMLVSMSGRAFLLPNGTGTASQKAGTVK